MNASLRPGRFRSLSEDQQLHVDPEALGALLLDEIGDVGARDEMDVDVLILVAAALADLADAMRADQGEAFRQHAGRRVKFAEPLDPVGGEAGLLLELLDRGAFDRRVGIGVADKAGGKLEAAFAERNPRLVDQDHLALKFGEDDDGADIVGAARIFPFAAPHRAHELARPHDFGAAEGRRAS